MILNLIQKLIKHELISGSFYIFIGSTISNFLAFLLNLFVARTLSFEDYGTFASILSLIILISLPSTSVNTIIVKFATDYFSKGDMGKSSDLYKNTIKILSFFSIAIFVFFAAFSFQIKTFLHLETLWYSILAGFIIALTYIAVINTAFLQSLLNFKYMAMITILGSVLRLASGVVLILLGFRVFGALWAIAAMSLAPIFIGFIPLRNLLFHKSEHVVVRDRGLFYFTIFAGISLVSLSSLTSTDVILVKHFFTAQEAGLYSGLSLVGKVIFYFTVPITTVMFPLLVKKNTQGEKISGLFYTALFIVALASILIFIFYFIFPEFAIKFFLGGERYISLVPYLSFFAVFIAIYNILSVFISFFLSIKKTDISWIVLAGAILQIILIYMFNENFTQVITASIISSGITLLCLIIYYIKLFIKIPKF